MSLTLSSYSSADDSLRHLPLPYDISSAVSRALRFDPYCGTDLHPVVPRGDSTLNLLPAYDGWVASKGAVPGYCAVPRTYSYSYAEDYALESYHIDMAVREMPPLNEMDPLGEFCKYIANEEEELPFPPTGAPCAREHRPFSIAESNPASTRPVRKARLKRRRTEYEDSPEVTPEKYSPPPLVNRFTPPPQTQAQRRNWKVSLANADLWNSFDEIGTEMVITKNGRRMFPAVSVRVRGLDPGSVYSIAIDILPTDDKRYKFQGNTWMPVGRAEKKQVYREYRHPDSPNLGSVWMEKPVAFKFVKLTNNKNTTYDEQVILNSMQKYQPFVKITSESDGVTQSYSFPETQFIAVTAYQNSKMTQLKVDHNPYARAFREGNPSETSTSGTGGHYLKRSSMSSAGSPEATPKRTRQRKSSVPRRVVTPAEVVTHCPAQQLSPSEPESASATSVESGFESGDGCHTEVNHGDGSHGDVSKPESSPIYVDDFGPGFLPLPDPGVQYGCPLGYWADTSLYNPALITAPPMLDSSSSFSEPYLQESCRVAMETSQFSPSPVKGFHLEFSDIDTSFEDTLVIETGHVHYEDDDVFL